MNLEKHSLEIKENRELIEKYKRGILKNKNIEKKNKTNSSFTTNTFFSFKIIEFDKESSNNYRLLFFNEANSIHLPVELNSSCLNKKYKIKIEDMNICLTLRLESRNNQTKMFSSFFEDFLNVKDFYEKRTVKKYTVFGFSFSLEYFFIVSKLDYYNRNISNLEDNVNSIKEKSSIIEKTFSNLKRFTKFLGEEQEKNEKYKTSELNLEDHEVPEKVEQLIFKIFGRTYIYWEKIFYTLNKFLFICLTILFLFRPEFLTLIICILVTAVEIKILSKSFYETLLYILSSSWLNDCIWFTFYLININKEQLQDFTGWSIRVLSTYISGFVILIKLIMIFSVWRLGIVQKYTILPLENTSNYTNPKSTTSEGNLENINNEINE